MISPAVSYPPCGHRAPEIRACRTQPVINTDHAGAGLRPHRPYHSVLGLATLAYHSASVANKFALEGLTDALRLEPAGSGAHAPLIEPGFISGRFRANG
jgi:NAD(P)-dependent dehydrogenase (short-subunit alcohol dehydrogenase family)